MRYRLLKDLPGIKANSIFEYCIEEDGLVRSKMYRCENTDVGGFGVYELRVKVVEGNPEWFQEIKEETKPEKIGLILDNKEYEKLKQNGVGHESVHTALNFDHDEMAKAVNYLLDKIK